MKVDARGKPVQAGDYVTLLKDRGSIFIVVKESAHFVTCDCVNRSKNYKQGHLLLPQYVIKIEPEDLI